MATSGFIQYVSDPRIKGFGVSEYMSAEAKDTISIWKAVIARATEEKAYTHEAIAKIVEEETSKVITSRPSPETRLAIPNAGLGIVAGNVEDALKFAKGKPMADGAVDMAVGGQWAAKHKDKNVRKIADKTIMNVAVTEDKRQEMLANAMANAEDGFTTVVAGMKDEGFVIDDTFNRISAGANIAGIDVYYRITKIGAGKVVEVLFDKAKGQFEKGEFALCSARLLEALNDGGLLKILFDVNDAWVYEAENIDLLNAIDRNLDNTKARKTAAGYEFGMLTKEKIKGYIEACAGFYAQLVKEAGLTQKGKKNLDGMPCKETGLAADSAMVLPNANVENAAQRSVAGLVIIGNSVEVNVKDVAWADKVKELQSSGALKEETAAELLAQLEAVREMDSVSDIDAVLNRIADACFEAEGIKLENMPENIVNYALGVVSPGISLAEAKRVGLRDVGRLAYITYTGLREAQKRSGSMKEAGTRYTRNLGGVSDVKDVLMNLAYVSSVVIDVTGMDAAAKSNLIEGLSSARPAGSAVFVRCNAYDAEYVKNKGFVPVLNAATMSGSGSARPG